MQCTSMYDTSLNSHISSLLGDINDISFKGAFKWVTHMRSEKAICSHLFLNQDILLNI